MGNYVSCIRWRSKEIDNSISWNSKQRLFCDECDGVCICRNTVGSCSCPAGAAPSPSCVFYSPRIQALHDGQRTEYETTQDTWTVADGVSKEEVKRVGKENRKYFDEVLVKHPEWVRFFTRFEDLKVGAKIGEGGQAEIFAATSQNWGMNDLVAKVWKEDVSLRGLEQQWPPQMLSRVAQRDDGWPFKKVYGGAFIRHGKFKNRFAFVLQRQFGDLRTLIDGQMLQLFRNNLHGPPFRKIKVVYHLLNYVLVDLRGLHDAEIVHRDIKASNVLLDVLSARPVSVVIDFECSVGITGTGFWRAPEILEQLQRGVPGHEVVFTKKADIYSFGMLCYEMITDCIPFEGHPLNDYSIVLRGERPKLPHDLDPKLREVILDCWQHDPQLRPTSSDLIYLHENCNQYNI